MTFDGRRSTGSRRLGGEATAAGNGMKFDGVDVSWLALSDVSSEAVSESCCVAGFEATCVFDCTCTNTSYA